MNLSRRELLAGAMALAVPLRGGATAVHLIAHRGGVVDADRPENSALAVEAAIAQGYWMIEVDIRRTRDGRAVLQHDPTFERYYGDRRSVETLTWPDIAALRSAPGNHAPLGFEDLCTRCAGKVRLMLDIKGTNHPRSFHEDLARTLGAHDLLDTAYVLSSGGAAAFWRGQARVAINPTELRAALARGAAVEHTSVLFEVASALEPSAVQLAQQRGVTVIAALNTFRYRMEGVDDRLGAQRDARRLLALGVRHFQIDSVYAPELRA